MISATRVTGVKVSKEDERSYQEREIVRLMALGYSDRQIASHLSIGVRTVERRRSELMRRIGASNYVSLGAYASQSGWISYKAGRLALSGEPDT